MAARLHRRDFLRGSVATALATQLHAAPAAAAHLNEFRYGAVTLTGGPMKRQYDAIHAHFLALDNDRLLKVYRQRAGLPAPGENMGGWYDADGFVPGHTLGQYISGLARIYDATKDPACAAKVNALVKGFAETLGPDGSAAPPARNAAPSSASAIGIHHCDCRQCSHHGAVLPGPRRNLYNLSSTRGTINSCNPEEEISLCCFRSWEQLRPRRLTPPICRR